MSLNTTTNRQTYAPNGVTTAFAVPFSFTNNADIQILSRIAGVDSAYIQNVDYTLAGAGAGSGTATFVVPPVAGSSLIILRVVPENQLTTYTVNDSFPSASHEAALDKLTQQVQQLQEVLNRCIKIPATDTVGVNTTLPIETSRANLALKFDASGNITAA